jgi:MtN3 and saliva related transmembrane protein
MQWRVRALRILRRIRPTFAVSSTSLIGLFGCQDLMPHDTQSLFFPGFHRSEVVGMLAGLGTTFAAIPDLVAMLKRRSKEGMNPRMAGITGIFQILWVYYGLLIASRPVIAWNLVAVMINFLSVAAFAYFARQQKKQVC